MSVRTLGVNGIPLELGVRTGVGRYLLEIVQRLPELLPGWQVAVLCRDPARLPPLPASIQVRAESSPRWRGLKPGLWTKLRARALLAPGETGVFWNPALPAVGRLPSSWRSVLTVHDLMWVLYPETMSSGQRWLLRFCANADLQRADRLVFNSEGTRLRTRTLARQHDGAVVRPAVDRAIFHPAGAAGGRGRFLLAVGTLEPRKNLQAVLAAFRLLRAAPEHQDLTLKVVGKQGWGRPEDVSGPGVEWLGQIDDTTLAGLYRDCTALLQCSLYEGYGMPVAEAVASGAPVVITDIPELREAAAGGRGVLTQPEATAIARATQSLLREPPPSLPAEAAPHTWDAAARSYGAIFQELAGGRPA